ncbi:MAG: transglutaminase family protein [Rhodospirillales bacterium]|nr:transglutaminase family protein [Rhodospirillales bacterium]
MTDPGKTPLEQARHALEAIGRMPEAEIALGSAAIQLGRIDAPEADWHAAEATLTEIARAAAALAPAEGAARAGALAALLGNGWGFSGDTEDYDHPDNANLIRVLRRRKGLPVALGIVWLHAARAAGWEAHGVDFPGHFLIALPGPAGPVAVDAFDGGTALPAPALRALLKRVAGPDAELTPDLLRPMGNRAVLLRLANNIRARRLTAGDLAGALATAEDMLRIAPDAAPLWRETAALHRRLDQVSAALACLARYLALVPEGEAAARARAEMAALRARLN